MKRSLVLAFLAISFAVSASAQSGRKVRPTPTPIPAATTDTSEASDYSESQSTNGPSYSRRGSKKQAEKPKDVQPTNDTKTGGGDDDVIRVSTDLVTIPVSVYERSGVYVSGLRRTDFKIFEDGKEQEVAYFGNVEVPFSVILLIDTSGSTTDRIKAIRQSALEFIDNLRPIDKVMVIQFSSSVDTLCDFTSDRPTLERAIGKVGGGGGTALYNAVETALRKKLAAIQGRKAVVLLTDGVDTSGYNGEAGDGFEKTLAMAEEGDAIVYSVYYNTYLDSRGIGGSNGPMSGIPTITKGQSMPGDRPEDYARGRFYLEELARLTGGKMFRSESTTGGLSSAFEGVANELGNQYVLGFYPTDPGENGQRRTLKVRINRSAVAVRARDSYIVGASPAKK